MAETARVTETSWVAYRRSTKNSWPDRTIFGGGRYCYVTGCTEDALVEVGVNPLMKYEGQPMTSYLPACWNHGPGKYGVGRDIAGWST